MVFQQDILDLNNLFKLSNLSTFIHNIPVEWVKSTLRLSSPATIRRRCLPADQVLWLVLGMAIFRDVLIHEAARRLNICTQWLASYDLLTRISLTNTRKTSWCRFCGVAISPDRSALGTRALSGWAVGT